MPSETLPDNPEAAAPPADKFSLEVIGEDQAEAVHAWANRDPEYLKLAGPEALKIYASPESVRAIINNPRVVFQDMTVGGKRVGNIFLNKTTVSAKTGEIGFIVDPNEQGKGYAKEAIAAMSDFGFTELGLETISAKVARGNKASANALYAVGFNMINFIESDKGPLLLFQRPRGRPARGYKTGYLNPGV